MANAFRKACVRYRVFIAAMVLGLVVRIVLAPLGWHAYDMFTFADWAWQLLEEPRSQFYAAPLEVPGDHLPGDLTLMWVMAHLTHLIAPLFDYFDDTYVLMIKSVPIVCDLILAVGILMIARIFTTERRAIVIGSVMALNPASIVISAMWGQWDSVSMALVVFALYALLRKWTWLALPLLACACLFKPQLGVLIPIFAIADLRLRIPPGVSRRAVRPWLRSVRQALPGWLAGGAASVALVLAICIPFNVGFPGMHTRYSLFERIQYAVDRYESTTHGAYNIWYLLFPETRWDGETVAFGLSYHAIGFVLFGIGMLVVVIGALVIDPWPVALAWSGVVSMMAIYMLPTRVHERYLFPAVVLAFLLWIVAPQWKWLAFALSVTSFVGVYLSYSWYKPAIDIGFLQNHLALQTISVVNIVIFGALILWGFRGLLVPLRTKTIRTHSEPAGLHGAESTS